MFGYQRNFNSEVEIIDSVEKFNAILRDPSIVKRLEECHTYMEMGNEKAYAAAKRGLPMWIFSAASFDKTKKRIKGKAEGPEGYWRVQEAAHLNGLCSKISPAGLSDI